MKLKEPTDIERKLQAIKAQLYGKETATSREVAKHDVAAVQDITYLMHDLKKTAILASLAIGVQLLIFMSINRGLVKF